ncbi:hypothetical protein Syun_017809 [Stephania yunnanensis]|uniref:Dirigent protein n=1 Tax=Stephania yunnanensis TaxID=152371 RepID=A0AAP0J784_9MAGN
MAYLILERSSPLTSTRCDILSDPCTLNQEKLSHFHFYWHDKLGGRDPTAVQVATSTINVSPATRFGDVYVVDDPLTEGPTAESKMVGRAQGLYTYSSKEEVGVLMAMNFVFMVGEYSGSTITILGRNIVMSKEREMAVVGGSGLFRFARGYAKLKTYSLSVTTAIVEYDVFLMHSGGELALDASEGPTFTLNLRLASLLVICLLLFLQRK